MDEKASPQDVRVVPTAEEHTEALEELQRTVFPTLADAERFKRQHYLAHIELFPEGQFVAVDGSGRVVGMTTTIRCSFDFDHIEHTWAAVYDGGWLSSHQADGDWLYGCDMGTHPEFRRRGIARKLYAARHTVVQRLGLRGQILVGLLAGYGAHVGDTTPERYYRSLLAGERTDPTVSFQMRLGFEPRGLIPGYVDDPGCGDCGVLLVLPADRKLPCR